MEVIWNLICFSILIFKKKLSSYKHLNLLKRHISQLSDSFFGFRHNTTFKMPNLTVFSKPPVMFVREKIERMEKASLLKSF